MMVFPEVASWRLVPSLALTLSSLLIAAVLSAKPPADANGRALVLGGGGPVGEAWESGVIAGLMEKGIDVYRANKIVGTSAGSIVGARVAAGMTAAELTKAALTEFRGPPPAGKPPPPP